MSLFPSNMKIFIIWFNDVSKLKGTMSKRHHTSLSVKYAEAKILIINFITKNHMYVNLKALKLTNTSSISS